MHLFSPSRCNDEPGACTGHSVTTCTSCKLVQKEDKVPRGDECTVFPAAHTCFVNCTRDCSDITSSSESLTASSSSSSSSSFSRSDWSTGTAKSTSHLSSTHASSTYTSRGFIAIVIMELLTVLTVLLVAVTLSRSTAQVTLHQETSSALSSSLNSTSGPSMFNMSSGDQHHLRNHHRRHHHPHDSSIASRPKPTVKPLTGKSAFLRREMLKNTSVTCNDGTRAGYYVRYAANGSNKWLIYLEGGGHCFSRESCQQRWIRVRALMSSAHWPMMRSSKSHFFSLPLSLFLNSFSTCLL